MAGGIQEKMNQEPQARPPEQASQEEIWSTPPEKAMERHCVGRIDREHLIGGEMSDILRGILGRVRLPRLLAHHSHVAVLALFRFINGCLSIGLMSAASMLTRSPFVFPSLGPTAFLYPDGPERLPAQYADWPCRWLPQSRGNGVDDGGTGPLCGCDVAARYRG